MKKFAKTKKILSGFAVFGLIFAIVAIVTKNEWLPPLMGALIMLGDIIAGFFYLIFVGSSDDPGKTPI